MGSRPPSPLPTELAPYRAGARPRYVCLVCYHVFDGEGACPPCDAPLHAIDDAAVREQLRDEAERRLERKKRLEEAPLFLAALVLVAPLVYTVGIPYAFWTAVVLAFPVEKLLVRAWARRVPGSAVATYAARRRRAARELGLPDVDLAPVAGPADHLARYAGDDPQDLDGEQLLRWITVDGAR